MPLKEAVRYIQSRKRDFRCVELKYADKVCICSRFLEGIFKLCTFLIYSFIESTYLNPVQHPSELISALHLQQTQGMAVAVQDVRCSGADNRRFRSADE